MDEINKIFKGLGGVEQSHTSKKSMVEKNRKFLVSSGIDFSVFEPTETGLKKSILDATQAVRIHFEMNNFHNYDIQLQGPEYKVVKNAWLLKPRLRIKSKVSLYKPLTKAGDPRMWFSGLQQLANAGDQIATFIFNDSAFLLNISEFDVEDSIRTDATQVSSFISENVIDFKNYSVTPDEKYSFNKNKTEKTKIESTEAIKDKSSTLLYKEGANSGVVNNKKNVQHSENLGEIFNLYQTQKSFVVDELLGRLRVIAKNPFPSERSGSTGLGYTLEKLLGISANSSKQPDYKGIEIKAGRGNLNRTTLFAQVSDWKLSPCKSSAEILAAYGYQREGHFKLYCTISALKPNSQGLIFSYDTKADELHELHNNKTIVAIWPGSVLRQRLMEKHAETFWVDAESTLANGVEYFQLKSVTHTRAPIVSQLIPLITSGAITMDHLIKRNEETNKVTEKGPLFKIHKRALELLFPKPVKYQLI